ncbi:MAG: ABC transporter substrate-binding protein, partial [Salinigranum sp.]
MVRKIERRDLLKGLSLAGVTVLAGCTGGSGGSGGDGGDGGGDGDSGGSAGSGGTATSGDGGSSSGATETATPSGSAGGRTIKHGILMPLTGGLGKLGVPIKNGAILPAKQLEGQTDFTIDTKVADTQTDPNAGQTAAQSLVNAGYPAITGAAGSEVTIQVAK